MKQRNRIPRMIVLLGMSATLAACSGPGPRPDSEMQLAEAAIRQAEEANARKHEPVLLNQAQNKLADARKLMEEEEYEQAKALLEQAEVDAQLAAAQSETAKAQIVMDEINANIEELKKQLDMEMQKQ
ncbi:DUF4398 domain-containing protein [Motiliproteus sp. SC1-56]|uniref:DUF4398 domain-containing protein n=1 Tax=Motiliproteus sp. SC1-56 TaxID=2799565 RepID=UPI001A90885C|nr:DUF4398 domain-containing protein [Motiliproteus sp. SC1-56]